MRNAIGSVIDFAQRQIEGNVFQGERLVIDVSADSAYSWNGVPLALARERAIEAGITINGLAVLCRTCSGRPAGGDLEASSTRCGAPSPAGWPRSILRPRASGCSGSWRSPRLPWGAPTTATAAIGDVFGAALARFGRIWGERLDHRPAEMVAFVLRALEGDDYGVLRNVVAAFQAPLGETGRALLKQRLEAKLAKLPQPKADDWRLRSRRGIYVSALEELADAVGDVDAYIAASAAEPASDAKRHAIAERLLAAGRAEEALAWLAQCGEHFPERLVDLRLRALEGVGRKDEAQALRWSWFERTMSATHAREFVRQLPDFDGFEAEHRAVRTALDHADGHAALRFLLELPDLAAADQLVRRDIDRLNPSHYDLFNLAAERLAERFPLAAILLWRRKVEDVLARASSSQYGHAVRDLRQAASIAPRIADDTSILAHQAWMERLRRQHGRKWRIWELAGERR